MSLAEALTGMGVLDRRFCPFLWRYAHRAALVLVAGLVFFVAWDLSGIGLGIFFRGESAHGSGSVVPHAWGCSVRGRTTDSVKPFSRRGKLFVAGVVTPATRF